MDIQASIEQVAGILIREDLDFATHQDGDSYRLLFNDDAVFISFTPWGRDRVRIALVCPAVQGIEPETAGHVAALARANELNQDHGFVKWVLDGDTLSAVHDLLGDHLQAGELLNAVYTLAHTVNMVADELVLVTGGERWGERYAEELAELGAEDE